MDFRRFLGSSRTAWPDSGALEEIRDDADFGSHLHGRD